MLTRYKIVPVEDHYVVLAYEQELGVVEEFDYDKAWQVFIGTWYGCSEYIEAKENGWL
jgi:hypothetical protein